MVLHLKHTEWCQSEKTCYYLDMTDIGIETQLMHTSVSIFQMKQKETIIFTMTLSSTHDGASPMWRLISVCLWSPGADPGFGQGGTLGSEAESCRRSEAESHEQSEQICSWGPGPA